MNSQSGASFDLEDILQAARELLAAHPGIVVRWRLLRQVLRLHPEDPGLVEAKRALKSDSWVQQLERSQLADGSWGRFHTQDTKLKTVFRTTEQAIDRAFALGLEPTESPLTGVRQYILNVLRGTARLTDRDEKHPAWPLGIKFILAGRLAQIDPAHPMIDPYWGYLVEVASQAFTSGSYRKEDEEAAYVRLSGIRWPRGFLASQHSLHILSSRELPAQLEENIIRWIWHKPDGIGYLGTPLYELHSRLIGPWLRSMNILSRFPLWRQTSTDCMNRVWEQRAADGFWDFGSHIAPTVDFPLSANWRRKDNRRLDYSTCILALLRRYFD